MKLELNLLKNSYDYLYDSLELYSTASEGGRHITDYCNLKNKSKWKLAFICMVQATELLLKEGLYRIHPNLIYENIDILSLDKTISIQHAINRLNNFNNNIINDYNSKVIIDSSKIRNKFIHSTVSIESEKIISKYSELYTIYNELHSNIIKTNIPFDNKYFKRESDYLLNYNIKFSIYRGTEMLKESIYDLKEEISNNKNANYYITKEQKKIERIRYGEELKCISHSDYYTNSVCNECGAKKGEYHLPGCDCEICPICYRQVLSCGCILEDDDSYFMTSEQ